VHTHNRGAVQNRGSHSRRSRKLQASRIVRVPQKRLPRRGYQNRQREFLQLPESGEDLVILLAPLSETDTGIDHETLTRHAASACAMDGRF
jgi:hypothetical protein